MKQSPKVFENLWLERLTQTSFVVVMICFIPIFFITLYFSLLIPWYRSIPLFLIGIISWSLTEYAFHRFIFHGSFLPRYFNRFYLIIHGIHHENPLDKNRLLVPWYVSLPLAGLFFYIFTLFLGKDSTSLFCGFILGYLNYDITHYKIHLVQPKTKLAKLLRAYHFRHHFKNNTKNFGVTSPTWDYIANTRYIDKL